MDGTRLIWESLKVYYDVRGCFLRETWRCSHLSRLKNICQSIESDHWNSVFKSR